MSHHLWHSNRVPVAPHPFAHFIANDQWLLISGVGGHDEQGNLAESAAEQAHAALQKVERVLAAEQCTMAEVVWFIPYITDRADALAVDEVIRAYLPDPSPASDALTIVGLVDPRMKVEFSLWVFKGARLVVDKRPVLFAPNDPE